MSALGLARQEPPQERAAANAMVELRGVTKSYRMGKVTVPALRGVDLDVGEGELVALAGPSGSGKSTLLNLCGLLDTPDSGSYRLAGQDTGRLDAREQALFRRTHLGFVFQGFNLVPVLTAFDNVEVPLLLGGASRRERGGRVREALAAVGLADLARRRPDELSGGQRQRVAIARALVTRPRLVLADEPTANLDGASASQVIDLMRDAGRALHTTFLVATHDERMARRCDRVVAVRDGVIA